MEINKAWKCRYESANLKRLENVENKQKKQGWKWRERITVKNK